MAPVLTITADAALADDLARLCAATGHELVIAAAVDRARGAWASAPFVAVGSDVAADVAAAALPRRSGVVVVHAGGDDAEFLRAALRLGAEDALGLPADERLLAARLADATEATGGGGPLIAVVPGCGGAGASTLAVSLAHAAAGARGRCLLVDADPLGGGLDLLLELDDAPGLRWADLAATRGRVLPDALRAALPADGGVVLVSGSRPPVAIPAEPLASVCDAGRRGFAVTVVDLGDPITATGGALVLREEAHAVLAMAYRIVVVVPAGVRAAAAAAGRIDAVRAVSAATSLAVRRSRGSGIDATSIADALGVPLLVEYADDRVAPPRIAGSRSCGRALWTALGSRRRSS